MTDFAPADREDPNVRRMFEKELGRP